MPKTLDTQGFSGLREEVVRSEGRSSRPPVLQALIVFYDFAKTTRFSGGLFFCLPGLQTVCDGALARTQRSGSGGERRRNRSAPQFSRLRKRKEADVATTKGRSSRPPVPGALIVFYDFAKTTRFSGGLFFVLSGNTVKFFVPYFQKNIIVLQ